MRWLFSLFFLATGLGFGLSCDNLEDAFELELESLGIVYFQDLEASNNGQSLTLFNGICLIAEEGWRVESAKISVLFTSSGFFVRASTIVAEVFGWTLNAERLEAFTDTLVLYDLLLIGEDVKGSAKEARFDISTTEITFLDISAQTPSLRISGASAQLFEDTLVFTQALATTCVCEGDALYSIGASEASFSYLDESLSLKDSQLHIGTLRIPLGDQTLSKERFSDFSLPVSIDYSEDNPATATRGSGLGLRIPKLGLTDAFTLDVGIFGLDADYDLNAMFLANYHSEQLSFSVGKNRFGPQADFSYSQVLLPWLKFNLSMLNRHWLEQDFVHDASLSLHTNQSLSGLGLSGGNLAASLFTALSSQNLGDSLSSPRLGGSIRLSHALASNDLGQFKSSLELKTSYYPSYAVQQYGVILASQWRKNFSQGSALELGYNQIWTNGNSPFSKKLDKLEPSSSISASFLSKESLSDTLTAELQFRSSYNLLLPKLGLEAFQELSLLAGLGWQLGEFRLNPFMDLHLEGLFNPGLPSGKHSYFRTGLNLLASDWDLGTSLRLDLSSYKLESLELSSSFSLYMDRLTLKPYIALDILPSLQEADLPRVAGHGLSLSLDTCCGIIDLAYKQYNNQFSTSFNLRFE